MRNLINIFEDFNIGNMPNPEELEAFKSIIAGKIKQLPDDDKTAKTLKEIEELLQHVQAGGRMGMINGQLQSINDPAVTAAQKKLAQYLASMEVDPKDRQELFTLWRGNNLVNIDNLLSKKSHTFADIFTNYGKNPAITELVNDVMEEQALGQGKGEFGLNVLSKSVTKPGKHYEPEAGDSDESKGDLLIKLCSKWRKVEIKTTHGGAARFSDQEVRPAQGYEAAAARLNGFVNGFKNTTMYKELLPKGIPAYGINLRVAILLYERLKDSKYGNEYLKLVQEVVTLIFGGPTADKKAVKNIMTAFKFGDGNAAMQAYSQASFNYYMGKKDDEGVLAVDLNQKTFMFYSVAEDLTKEKLRLDAKTVYLTAKDVARGAYPQLAVVPTTFGANAKAAAEKRAQADAVKAAKAKNIPDYPAKVPGKRGPTGAEVQQSFTNYATMWARANGVASDKRTIGAIVNIIMSGRQVGLSNKKIEDQLKQIIPATNVATPKAPMRERRETVVQRARR
jgi:hypothetical protein